MSTKVSDIIWVHSTQPDFCFEVPEVWKKRLVFKYDFIFKGVYGTTEDNYSPVILVLF